jgi:hypothetical protein
VPGPAGRGRQPGRGGAGAAAALVGQGRLHLAPGLLGLPAGALNAIGGGPSLVGGGAVARRPSIGWNRMRGRTLVSGTANVTVSAHTRFGTAGLQRSVTMKAPKRRP